MNKLNIGCGDMILSGYVNADYSNPHADILCNAMQLPFRTGTFDEIYASHLIEHFHFHDCFKVLKEWKRVLKKGGWLVMETPDLLASCRRFLEADDAERINNFYPHFFGMGWLKGGAHLFLFTPQQMRWTLEQTGFKNISQHGAFRYIGKENICMKFKCQK